MKTTGDLRKELAECFALSKNGKLSGDALRGVIGCANQINTSLAIEVKYRAQIMKEGSSVTAMGHMNIGGEDD